MILPKFDYYSPRSLDEATLWLSEHRDERVKILAGGTDLLVDIRSKIIPDPRFKNEPPDILMALSRIPELRGISVSGSRISIRAMTTIAELTRSSVVRRHLTGLAEGADHLGSPLVRNRGTYGGNLCNARPAADTAIPTLALGGKLVIVSARGERTVDHNDFVTGPGMTILETDEIIKEVIFDHYIPTVSQDQVLSPPAWQGGVGGSRGSTYIKLANRKALEISVVGAAAALTLSDDRTIASVRIALGSVAPKPLLIPDAGEFLIGKEISEDTAHQAAKIAAEIAEPITDHRGSREYRLMMIEVLVRRVLMCSYARALTQPALEVGR